MHFRLDTLLSKRQALRGRPLEPKKMMPWLPHWLRRFAHTRMRLRQPLLSTREKYSSDHFDDRTLQECKTQKYLLPRHDAPNHDEKDRPGAKNVEIARMSQVRSHHGRQRDKVGEIRAHLVAT